MTAIEHHANLIPWQELAARTGVLVPEVDLGGGYGIAYLPGEVALDPARIAKDVAASVAQSADWSALERAGVGLWRANYGQDNGSLTSPNPGTGSWSTWQVHKYTQEGRLAGYAGPLDLNRAKAGVFDSRPSASGTATPTPEVKPNILEDEPMYIVFIDKFGHYLITPSYVRKIEKKGTITAIEKITGRGVTVLPFAEFYETWTEINAANLSDTALAGKDEIEELAKKLGL